MNGDTCSVDVLHVMEGKNIFHEHYCGFINFTIHSLKKITFTIHGDSVVIFVNRNIISCEEMIRRTCNIVS